MGSYQGFLGSEQFHQGLIVRQSPIGCYEDYCSGPSRALDFAIRVLQKFFGGSERSLEGSSVYIPSVGNQL